MYQGITIELHFFLYSILWGAIVLLAYDQLRVLRRIIRHNSIIISLEDLVFWVVASVFIFAMIYVKNSGTIRGFSVMGMVIGMVLYHYILSDWIVLLISRGILLLLCPFNFVFKWLKKGLNFIIGKSKKIINRLYIRLKRRLKSVKLYIINHRSKRNVKSKTVKKKDRKKKRKKKAGKKPVTKHKDKNT